MTGQYTLTMGPAPVGIAAEIIRSTGPSSLVDAAMGVYGQSGPKSVVYPTIYEVAGLPLRWKGFIRSVPDDSPGNPRARSGERDSPGYYYQFIQFDQQSRWVGPFPSADDALTAMQSELNG